jgi:hypothetical protein
MTELDKRFEEIYQKRKECLKLQAAKNEVQERLLSKKRDAVKYKRVLDKEHKEFKQMEGLSLISLFHSIKGDKYEKLEKEKKEYLAAKLNYDRLQEEVELIESQKSDLKQKIDAFGELEQEYTQVLKEREAVFIQEKGEAGMKLYELSLLKNQLKTVDRETKEAISAGKKVVASLNVVLSSLDSAEGWGTFDMLGGGLIATAVKHSRLDDAKALISQTQYLMDDFARELKDVDMHLDANKVIDISGFETFADYFFDGLIFDFMVQDKIHKSINHTQRIRSRVNNILDKLERDRNRFILDEKKLEEEREKILVEE